MRGARDGHSMPPINHSISCGPQQWAVPAILEIQVWIRRKRGCIWVWADYTGRPSALKHLWELKSIELENVMIVSMPLCSLSLIGKRILWDLVSILMRLSKTYTTLRTSKLLTRHLRSFLKTQKRDTNLHGHEVKFQKWCLGSRSLRT